MCFSSCGRGTRVGRRPVCRTATAPHDGWPPLSEPHTSATGRAGARWLFRRPPRSSCVCPLFTDSPPAHSPGAGPSHPSLSPSYSSRRPPPFSPCLYSFVSHPPSLTPFIYCTSPHRENKDDSLLPCLCLPACTCLKWMKSDVKDSSY